MFPYMLGWIFSLLAVSVLSRQSVTASRASKFMLASSLALKHAHLNRNDTPKSRVNAQVGFQCPAVLLQFYSLQCLCQLVKGSL